MIKIDKISKSFADKIAVDAVSFEAKDNEILVILGTSGSGKTTTLKMINRLIEPDSGSIFIKGENIQSLPKEELRKSIGYVMQHSGLFPHYTVAENIAILPNLLKWDKTRITQRTKELLEKLNLSEEMLKKMPHELSGGQQQRVGIARALIVNTSILLMDEPFGSLDTITKTAIHKEFKSLEELKTKTTVLVTHDVQEAFDLGHRICLMDNGRIIQQGTPKEILYQPANDFVKNFFAAQRVVLEYKITKFEELIPFLSNTILLKEQTNLNSEITVWDVLQKYSVENRFSDQYQEVLNAFIAYRKLQTV
ncbi:glycine/betaine ABC transporter ATP-binding protein [Flavobacterium sp. Root901]|uniref:ABC transporter ATP-binding protein n=1 Tax=Flavobacterium sp. Root901 TaxID=1736605 RepID=UPI00070E6E7B|nr:ABC transporter ATP-binding protein [Flavobacterium sp. Root901]KRD12389.1 glycine/betaine ABC transporter ATP-binding protein [Flavobacterium sp. Root901]